MPRAENPLIDFVFAWRANRAMSVLRDALIPLEAGHATCGAAPGSRHPCRLRAIRRRAAGESGGGRARARGGRRRQLPRLRPTAGHAALRRLSAPAAEPARPADAPSARPRRPDAQRPQARAHRAVARAAPRVAEEAPHKGSFLRAAAPFTRHTPAI